jgi:hypothetical protein
VISNFDAFFRQLLGKVSYVTPRRIEQGPRPLNAQRELAPDARNLAEVLLFFQLNYPNTLFSGLIAFMSEAFPEIETITVKTQEDVQSTPPTAEPAILYRHARDRPIPLRLSGSGIEQMLALAIGVMTAQPGRLFLIDEPQAYLHPHAERSLLRLLDEHEHHQFIIATNSSVLLNARVISQARLLSIEEGATQVTEPVGRDLLLTELEITAGDLWLADAVLWVEGASEVEVFNVLAAELAPSDRAGLVIRRMPAEASRFSSENERRADATYQFCDEVSAAVAPLAVSMRFLFDPDDKSDDMKERIEKASRGRAVFLPVRELENLFLSARVIHASLVERSELLDQPAPSLADVVSELQETLRKTDDRKLYPRGLQTGEREESRVRGSEVLQRLYWNFTTSDYDKPDDARRLAQLAQEHEPAALEPLRGVLRLVL